MNSAREERTLVSIEPKRERGYLMVIARDTKQNKNTKRETLHKTSSSEGYKIATKGLVRLA